MIHFAPIALPKDYRRSFVAKEASLRASTFAVILAQLAPEKYRALHEHDPLSVYWALLNHCSTLFPVSEPEWFSDDFSSREEMLYYMEEEGIPIYPLGVEDWDLEYGERSSLSIIAYLLEQPAQRLKVRALRNGMGKAWRDLWVLEPFWDKQIEERWIEPPKGRQWRGRWVSMPMLVKYIQHDTRYQWLDVPLSDCGEGGYPYWSIEDVQFLARDWAETKPVWKALRKFIEWLDDGPGSRLPWVLWALTGDEKVRMKLSEPKREKVGPTLAEVFGEAPDGRNG